MINHRKYSLTFLKRSLPRNKIFFHANEGSVGIRNEVYLQDMQHPKDLSLSLSLSFWSQKFCLKSQRALVTWVVSRVEWQMVGKRMRGDSDILPRIEGFVHWEFWDEGNSRCPVFDSPRGPLYFNPSMEVKAGVQFSVPAETFWIIEGGGNWQEMRQHF